MVRIVDPWIKNFPQKSFPTLGHFCRWATLPHTCNQIPVFSLFVHKRGRLISDFRGQPAAFYFAYQHAIGGAHD